ncbi:MAG: glycosyltransferase [Mucilaginibacter polytrichastri]|nr:glycosyltransferase [Mucilaginibacter polytrichastri]
MKIVHLNAYDGNGGAGRACLRLNTALRAAGVDSQVLVNFAFGRHPHVEPFSPSFFGRAKTALAIKAEQALARLSMKALKVPFSVPFFGRDVFRHVLIQEADIIHLHWVNHAFLKPENIAQLRSLNKPVVWTFHDSNAFTGGCHVRYTCDHFERECGQCPLLKKSSGNDLSHRIWKRKEQAYAGFPLQIIAPSSWMAASVKRSSLMGAKSTSTIPNTLETDVFSPPKIRIERKRFVMLSGFMPSRLDAHKGTSYLLEALQRFSTMPDVNPQEVELKIFGNRENVQIDIPFHLSFCGVISDDKKLAATYADADVFLAPSLEDNLPYTVMESLSCGTPVVAFRTGGIPDIVRHQQNGYLAGYRSAEDFAAGIYAIYRQQNRQEFRDNARKTIEDHFSEPVISQKHIHLYQSLLHE